MYIWNVKNQTVDGDTASLREEMWQTIKQTLDSTNN